MEVCLRLFLVSFHGSNEDGAEIGRRRRCRRTLGHGGKLLYSQLGEFGDKRYAEGHKRCYAARLRRCTIT